MQTTLPDPSCLTLELHFNQLWTTLNPFDNEADEKFSRRQYILRAKGCLIINPLREIIQMAHVVVSFVKWYKKLSCQLINGHHKNLCVVFLLVAQTNMLLNGD